MGRSGRGAVLRSRGAAGQGWGSFGEVRESPGKVGAGKHGGVRLGRWRVIGAGEKPMPQRVLECWGLGRRSRSRAGGIATGFHTALPGNTLFKRGLFWFFFFLLD